MHLPSCKRDVLFDALDSARAVGKTVAFDTNLRPRLWANTEDMKATMMLAAGRSDIVLPSHEDEAAWFGDADPMATLDRYVKAGARHVVVKNSAEAVVYQYGKERGEVTVDPAHDVVDTTAAGDSFNAGVLSEVIRHNNMVKGITLGCLLAGEVVRHKGALVAVDPEAGAEER